MSAAEFSWLDHVLDVGEKVAVCGLPGGGMPLGVVEAVNAKRVRVKMFAAGYGVVHVERERIDPIDWRCSQHVLMRQQTGFELRVDSTHHYWLWRLDGHLTIVRPVAADECTADLARLAVERVPWVECPCIVDDLDVLARPQYVAEAVQP